MQFKDNLIKKSWNSKSPTIFNNTARNVFIKLMDKDFFGYFNVELIKNKRSGVQEDYYKKLVPIVQSFDSSKFNFEKIDQSEILLCFDSDSVKIYDEKIDNFDNFASFILINKSPIFNYHCLIVPNLHACLQQKIDNESLFIVIKFMHFFGMPTMKIGFNSLGAYSSINHLHFHCIFSDELPIASFAIEKSNKKLLTKLKIPIVSNNHSNNESNCFEILFFTLEDYPVKAIVLETFCVDLSDMVLKIVANIVNTLLNFLLDKNIAFNMMMSDLGNKIYLIPRKNEAFNEREEDFRWAWLEICGFIICRNQKAYDSLNLEELTKSFGENVDLESEKFEVWLDEIRKYCENFK